jgi:glutamate/tyrosine decarboxylase-like PLP-dependent enzyme
MAFKHLGADWYADVVDRQLRLTHRVAEAVADLPDWHVAIPPTTAIITFRYEPEELRDAAANDGPEAEKARKKLDRLQILIAKAIQQEGRFWISAAPVPGGFALRLNVISWLTSETLVDELLAELPRYAQEARKGPA